MFDPLEALATEAPLLHPGLGDYPHVPWFFPEPETNVAHRRRTLRGDLEAGFAAADVVLEDTYRVPRYAHCAIEPHVVVARQDHAGRLTVWAASQSPYTQRHVFAQALEPLGLSHQDIRVVTPYVGGGFGGKAGVSMEILGAVLATAVRGHPVKLRWTREQEFYNTYQRQGLVARLKVGAPARRDDHRPGAPPALRRRGLRRVRGQRGQRRRPVGHRPLPHPGHRPGIGVRLHQPAARRALPGLRVLRVHLRPRSPHDPPGPGHRDGPGGVPPPQRHRRRRPAPLRRPHEPLRPARGHRQGGRGHRMGEGGGPAGTGPQGGQGPGPVLEGPGHAAERLVGLVPQVQRGRQRQRHRLGHGTGPGLPDGDGPGGRRGAGRAARQDPGGDPRHRPQPLRVADGGQPRHLVLRQRGAGGGAGGPGQDLPGGPRRPRPGGGVALPGGRVRPLRHRPRLLAAAARLRHRRHRDGRRHLPRRAHRGERHVHARVLLHAQRPGDRPGRPPQRPLHRGRRRHHPRGRPARPGRCRSSRRRWRWTSARP